MSTLAGSALLIDPSERTLADQSMYIDGEWVPAAGGDTFESLDPSTGKVIGSVPRGGAADVDRAVKAARRALPEWSGRDAFERGMVLRELSQVVAAHAEELARLEAIDSGHYYAKALQLSQATPLWFDYHAGLADKVGGRTIDVPGNRIDFTLLEPLGVTAHIVPWNYPFLVMARSVAPALAMGNTVVIKPAEQTPLTALMFAEFCEEIGLPPGIVNVVTGFGGEAGQALAEHPGVDGITFTGSVTTGKRVMKTAAENLTKVNLELGGKSPNIIFPDARLEEAAEGVMQAIFSHAGQVCIAGSRLFLHRDVHDQFLDLLIPKIEAIKVGDIFDDSTQMGPLVSEDQMDRVLKYVEIGKNEGAELLTGGSRVAENGTSGGYYVEPTVFGSVSNSMQIACEEIFGPVLSVIPWSDEDELIGQANDSEFGLFAGVWTQDITSAMRAAKKLECGGVVINDWFGEVPHSPHGGYKQSGMGREEGLESIAGYTQVKHVSISLDRPVSAGEGLPADWADAPL